MRSSSPHNPQLILYFLTSLVLTAAVSSYLTRIDISVRARGIVRPRGESIRIAAGASGRIQKMYVSEGVQVHQGAALIQLDTRDFLLKKKGLETSIGFAEARLEDLQQKLDEASAIEQQSASIDALDRIAAQRAAAAGMENARLRFTRYEMLLQEGLIARQSYDEARTALAQAEADESRISESSLQLKRAQAEARLSDLISAATPYRAELATLYHEVELIQAELERFTITSPADGQITSLAPLHEDELLAAGTVIANLTPASAPLVVESLIPASERRYIAMGQRVRLQIDQYTAFDGSVLSISPDSVSDAFHVTITTDSPLQLGMTFDVRYITRQERLLFLLYRRLRG
jgi:membrane fusion protein, peptide pheromone/bacteriocin exporter